MPSKVPLEAQASGSLTLKEQKLDKLKLNGTAAHASPAAANVRIKSTTKGDGSPSFSSSPPSTALAKVEGQGPSVDSRSGQQLAIDMEEKLEPVKNATDDPRIRLLNRLYARKRKELHDKKLLKKIGVKEEIFVVDLKERKVTKGAYEGKPDATFSFADSDFLAVATGKMNPQMAFIRGKMRIKGSMRAAQKFTPDIFPKPSKL
eukprot:jgi/Mesen1/8393/ME000468S07838